MKGYEIIFFDFHSKLRLRGVVLQEDLVIMEGNAWCCHMVINNVKYLAMGYIYPDKTPHRECITFQDYDEEDSAYKEKTMMNAVIRPL